MSRIILATRDDEVRVLGSERAYLGMLVDRVALGLLDLSSDRVRERVEQLIPATHWARQQSGNHLRYLSDLALAWRDIGGFGIAGWKGKPVSTWRLNLNTALVVGGDALKLAAKIHGQCEIHCWTEGDNAAFVADIIDNAVETGMYRPGAGWGAASELLRKADGPVVFSYTVSDTFPNAGIADWSCDHPEFDADGSEHEGGDCWYELTENERWDLGVAGLRASTGGSEITRDDWDTFRFGEGLSLFDLFAEDYADRFDRAFGITAEVTP